MYLKAANAAEIDVAAAPKVVLAISFHPDFVEISEIGTRPLASNEGTPLGASF